jgi:phosphomannomutase/phosphoglucomutase
VRKVVESSGGVPIMWKTGHSFIKTKIAAENASFGGELSGHFFFADNFFGHDDGAFGALRILECLSEMNMSLSKLYESFPLYISSPEIKVGCPDDKKFALIENLSQRFKNDFPNAEFTDSSVIPGDDGVRADFEDGMVIFRYSQNGPYITVKFEAKDQTVFDARKKYVREMLHSYPDILWDNQLVVNLYFLV